MTAATKRDIATRIEAAIQSPRNWDLVGLLEDAGHRIAELENAARSASDEIATVATIIREIGNTNLITSDILSRLNRAHDRLGIAEIETQEPAK